MCALDSFLETPKFDSHIRTRETVEGIIAERSVFDYHRLVIHLNGQKVEKSENNELNLQFLTVRHGAHAELHWLLKR